MRFSEKEMVGGIIILIIIGSLTLNLFWTETAQVKFCGDGICSDNENEVCKLDCNWCGDGSCNANECLTGCSKDCSLSQCENRKCEPEKGENCLNTPNDCKCIGGYCNTQTKQCDYQGCGNNVCDSGENPSNCPNDCKGESYQAEDMSDINYPIIFIHGHSMTEGDSEYSINSFKSFQEKLVAEGYAENRGLVLPKGLDLQSGSWSNTNKPISVRTTYYLDAYDNYGSYVGQEDNQLISIYSQRLGKVVDEVLDATGKKKVIIIAHSIGGLVSRYYIKNLGGKDKVDKLIVIGTPNHGVYGYIAFGCESWFGRNTYSPECEDMQYDSSFIASLNAGDETPGNVKYLTIAGNCENDLSGFAGDEVVRVGSVKLSGATNKVIVRNGCSGPETYHTRLIHPSQVPEVYNEVVNFLS